MNLQGLTQAEIIALLQSHPHLSLKEFKTMVSSMKINRTFNVNDVKIGDIFRFAELGGHPAVVISIKRGICYSLLLTTEATCSNILFPVTSRFLQNNYITDTLVSCYPDKVKKNLMAIYGHRKELMKAKQLVKNIINKL